MQLEQKHNGKRSTIIVEFYRTEEFERRSIPSKIHGKKYEAATANDLQKKNFADSLYIKAGRSFSLGGRGPNAPATERSQNENGGRHFHGNSDQGQNGYRGNNFDNDRANSQRNGGNFDNRRRDQKFQDKRDRFDNRNQGGRFGNQNNGSSFNDRRSFNNSNNNSRGGDPRGGNFGGGNFGNNSQNNDQNYEMTIDHKVLYDELIDSCEIHYNNWAYL